MHWQRVRREDWLTGAWGLGLLAVSFASWYSLLDGSLTMWQAFKYTDWVIRLVLVLAIGLPVVTAWRDSPPLPLAVNVVLTFLTPFALLLVVYRLLNQPGPNEGVELAWASVAGVICLLGIFVSSYFALRNERSPGVRPAPAARTMPAPPAEQAST